MTALRRLIPILALVVLADACGGARPRRNDGAPERTTLEVRNDNYLDHTIYLLVGGGAERVRLGVARGLSTSRFVIPATYVFGPTALQFLADPIGARQTPVSERVTVVPGDEVHIIIPSR